MENLVKIIRASLQGASITTQTVDAQAFIDIVGEMINHNPDSLYPKRRQLDPYSDLNYQCVEDSFDLKVRADYLTLGLSPQFLYDHPWLERYDIEKYRDAVHAAGGILVRAHPYRRAWYIKKPYVEREGIADAIEVFNGGNSSQEENDMALAYAQKHNMPMTGGSDAHHVDETARGYIALEKKAESYAELCEAIRTGKAIVMHK